MTTQRRRKPRNSTGKLKAIIGLGAVMATLVSADLLARRDDALVPTVSGNIATLFDEDERVEPSEEQRRPVRRPVAKSRSSR